MNLIFVITSAFIFIIGALTFLSSSEEAAEKKDYDALRTSSLMIVIGAFCLIFFMFSNIASALLGAVLFAIVLLITHACVSYISMGKYSLESSKLHEEHHDALLQEDPNTTQKMTVTYAEGADERKVLANIVSVCKKVDSDFEVR